jgi:hypothetical protein|tara:strand:- start:116 stop:742 length:627 start_codon:yes stop_codon:yes gene_type:complete
MKTLFSIIVLFFLFSSNLVAEKINGLFGIDLGSVVSEELNYTDIPYNEWLNSIDILKGDEHHFVKFIIVKPIIENQLFNNFTVKTTPISHKIVLIQALGEGKNKRECKKSLLSLENFFRDKYSSDYINYDSNKFKGTKGESLRINFKEKKITDRVLHIHCNAAEIFLTFEGYERFMFAAMFEETIIIKNKQEEEEKDFKDENTDTSGL